MHAHADFIMEKPTLKTELIYVTKRIADEYLEHNTWNRSFSRKRVEFHKKNITSGNWRVTHQGVGFYEDGELADGQHRLTAISETGLAQWMYVTWGLKQEDATAIDRHRPRSDADSIHLAGIAPWMNREHIATIKMIISLHTKDNRIPSAHQIVKVGKSIEEEVEFSSDAFRSQIAHITTSPVRAALALASRYEDNDRLREFADVLTSGMPHSEDDQAAVRLRDKLLTHVGRSGQGYRVEVALRTMRCIEAFCKRKQLKKLYTPEYMLYRIKGLEELL